MNGTAMVTGGTGYLGSAVVEELLSGGWHVRALVRDPARLGPAARGRCTAIVGDVRDRGSVVAAAEGADVVMHVAGLTGDWARDPAIFESVNVTGTANVLEAARRVNVPQVIVTSTVMVLGPSDGLAEASESTRRAAGAWPLEYQATKARALALARAARLKGQRVTVLYPGALYGPGPQTEGNYLARVMDQLRRGGYAALPRTTGLRWCLAHVNDVARGHRLALERGDPVGDYILGGDNVAFERMLEIIRDELALPALPRRVPGSVLLSGLALLAAWHGIWGTRPPMSLGGGRALLHDWAFSSRKAAAELGYSWLPFEEAFPAFARWFATMAAPAAGGQTVTHGR